jgi:hypothetical protein
MRTPASFSRFLAVCRAFGLPVAYKVICSKIRGKLNPAAALSEPPVYASSRQSSFLMRVEDHAPATLHAVAAAASSAGGLLEAVFCIGSLARATDASGLMRLRGACPWVRFVTAKDGVDEATAASWTVEQATGKHVVFVAKGFQPIASDLSRLLEGLEHDEGALAAGLFEADASGEPLGAAQLLALRKSFYLAEFPVSFPMTAPALFEALLLGGHSATRLPVRAIPGKTERS